MTPKLDRTMVYHELACLVGVDESILLQNISALCELNRQNKDYKYLIDDDWWVYASYETLLRVMPFFRNTKKIMRMVKDLESLAYLVSFTPRGIDKTKWYRVDSELIFRKLHAQAPKYIDF